MADQIHRQAVGEIELHLLTNLARYAGGKTKAFPVTLQPAETLGSLIRRFEIPREEIGMMVINDQITKNLETPLHPGDKVKIFGLVGGG